MARELSPAFQFYPDDWLSSSSVGAMTAEQRGCYINLLCYCWRDGAVADDDTVLAALARLPLKRWMAIKSGVLKPFTLSELGWTNDRIEQERQKQRDYHDKKSRAGSTGAGKRWHSHDDATGKPIANDSSPSSSPSSSSVQTPTVSEERAPAPDVKALVDAWNTGTTEPIPKCQKLSAQRAAHAKARLGERTLDGWRAIIARVEASAFCRGANDRGWVATFDWLIRSDETAVRVLEGKYDNREAVVRLTPRAAAAPAPSYAAPWCEHDPRCASPDVHRLLLAREGAA